jgi:hypothetical protein
MRKAGTVLLSLWAGLNALVALAVTVSTLLQRPPPALALMLSDAEIHVVDPRVLAVVQAQAAIANPLIIAVCALALFLAWTRPPRWWPALAATLLPVQAFGFISDAFLGGHNLVANLVSTLLLVLGLSLSRL